VERVAFYSCHIWGNLSSSSVKEGCSTAGILAGDAPRGSGTREGGEGVEVVPLQLDHLLCSSHLIC